MVYRNFFLMLLISFGIMYVVMFLNVDSFNHIFFSLTRVYMSLLMVLPMAMLMLLMMGKMYPNKKVNRVILTSSIALFLFVLVALRTQTPINDIQYMKAMIPHHSSAILTSKHGNLKDPEVRKLSEDIIRSQEQEIEQMKAMLKRLQHR